MLLTRTLGAAQPEPAMPGSSGKWRYVGSPNFEMYSQWSDRESREGLHNLEILRAVFFEHLRFQAKVRLDITVYAFESERDFRAYVPESMRGRDDLAGFYLGGIDRAVIVMGPMRDGDVSQKVVFHEYVHHLFRLAEQTPPLWFNEGTADLFAGMKVERNRVVVGTPMEDRALYLRQESLLPLEELFGADHSSRLYTENSHTGIFYAQSWALLHYWEFGDSSVPRDSVDRFLKVASSSEGVPPGELKQLFQSCFGCDYPQMLWRLRQYVHSGRYRTGVYPLPKLPGAGSYSVRSVPMEELQMRLGELALRVSRSGAGKLALLNAVQKNPGDPRPFEALGSEAWASGDPRSAVDYWEQSIAAGSKNPAVYRHLALMEGERWFSQYDDSFILPDELVKRMRSRLLRSIEYEPSQSASYALLAWVEAFASRPDPANINRVIAQLPTLPDKRRTLIALSRLMLRIGRPESALTMLEALGTRELELRDAEARSELLTRLATDYPQVRSSEEKKAPAQVAPPPAAPAIKAPSVGLPDDL